MSALTAARREALLFMRPGFWDAALGIGAYGSTMQALRRRGFVEQKAEPAINGYLYRITPAGRAALAGASNDGEGVR